MQDLTSYSCSTTLISYNGNEILRLSCLVIEIPILGLFGVFGVWGYLGISDAKSDIILARQLRFPNKATKFHEYLAQFWGLPFWAILEFRATFGVFSSSAKSDDIFLLDDPDFL